MIFIKLLISLTLFLGCLSEPCAEIRTRKEIRELTFEERSRLLNALKKLHEHKYSTEEVEELTEYEKLAKVHDISNPFAHGRPMFFPWHRVFLRYTEMKLQKIDPNVTLAYWDWSLDSKKPHLSEIFEDSFLGSQGKVSQDGNNDNDFCMTTGIFANVTFNYPEKHCFRRVYDSLKKDSIDELPSPEEILVAINEDKFSYFGYMFEAMHGYPHMNIGGDGSDFQSMYSPLDPIFYFHHTFIDFIWYQWQQKHLDLPIEDQFEGKRYRKKATLDDQVKPFSFKVRDTLNTTGEFFCYRYDGYPRDLIRPLLAPALVANGNLTGLLNISVSASQNEKLSRSINVPKAFFNPMLGKFKNLSLREILAKNKANSNKTKAGSRSLKPKEFELTKLKPLSDRWIRKNNLNKEIIQEDKQLIDDFKDILNDQKIFIPLAVI